jgi:hypothetical protein
MIWEIFMHNNMYQQPIVFYKCSLLIGNQYYFGEGETRQLAKHDAAYKAMQYLSKIPWPSNVNRTRKWQSKQKNTPVEQRMLILVVLLAR